MNDRDLKSIETLRVLHLLCASAPTRWTARELARELNLHPRSVQRYLQELKRHLVIQHDGYYQVRLPRPTTSTVAREPSTRPWPTPGCSSRVA